MIKTTATDEEVEIFFQTKTVTQLDIHDFDIKILLNRPRGHRMIVDDEVDYFILNTSGEDVSEVNDRL